MAFDPKFRMYLQNFAGDYYTATQGAGTWSVDSTTSIDPLADELYLKHLPKEWDKTQFGWDRDTTYMGVFRSISNNFDFTEDGRAILLYLYSFFGNTQAYATLRIDMLKETADDPTDPIDVWTYETALTAKIDFSEIKDDKKAGILSASLLDCELYSILKANASKQFNIPFYTWDADAEEWVTDANFIYHEGIKLIAQYHWTSGATATAPIMPQKNNPILAGFDNGGGGGAARHWIPAMQQYTFTTNNGSTTYLGNDILQPFLLQQSQAHNYNQDFSGDADIQAYTKGRGLIKNLLPNPLTTNVVDVIVTLTGKVEGTIDYTNFTSFHDQFVRFVLFEIGSDDNPIIVGGQYQYLTLHTILLPDNGSPFTPPSSGNFSSTTAVSLSYDKVYALGIIYDDLLVPIPGSSNISNIQLSRLELKMESAYNSGTSSPVDAPRFPPSTMAAFRPFQVFEKLVKSINSVITNEWGFPYYADETYMAVSDYLSDSGASRAHNYDLKPYNLMFTSENAIKNLKAQQYISTSVSEFFSNWDAISGVGLGIEGGGTTLRMEDLAYFFDASTLIYDLGTNVAKFEIEPLTDLKGDNIKVGFNAPDTNRNFGVDAFHFQQDYSTQLTNTPKEINLVASSVIVDQNTIEKARAQRNENEQSNTSAANGTILLDTTDSAPFSVSVEKPDGSTETVSAHGVLKYPTAQSTDPTAASAPYVRGLYYPETALNLCVTPASNLLRNGSKLNSMCYGTSGITFRKQYQMQYNNTPVELPGIEKNINAGSIIEVADVSLGSLGAKLYRPDLFKIETQTPVNFYNIINSNPYGYVSFTWISKSGVRTVYKGFLWNVTQNVGNNAATTITLLAHPDTTDADINAA